MTTTLHALKFVSAALHHAEALADEAEDLEALPIAERLRDKAAVVGADLDAAFQAIDDIGPATATRKRAHEVLETVYNEATLRIEALFALEETSRLSPGGHLDVSERVRFRLRQLPQDGNEELLDIRALLERAIFTYDNAVDTFLLSLSDAQTKKDRVIAKAQALRLELERAKAGLLVKAPVGSESYQRIKKRAVRTKRARWLDEARARRLASEAFA